MSHDRADATGQAAPFTLFNEPGAECGPGLQQGQALGGAGTDSTWSGPDLTLATADTAPAPALDITLFPGPWQPWIKGAAERAGAPLDYVACSVLAAVGAVIGNARWGSPWEGWAHPSNIWVACIGTPSAGKSPGISAAAVPVSDLSGLLNDDWEERAREYRTAKQAAKESRATWEQDVRDAMKGCNAAPQEPNAARDPDQPHKRRIYSTEPTIEKARDLSATNPRGLLLHRDELAAWVAGMGRYGNGNAGGDRGFWLQAYEGGRWASDRVKDGDDAPDIPHLTWGIVGGFQPDRLASVLLAGDDDGLAARFLYCWPQSPPGVSDRPSGRALPFDLVAMLRRLHELPTPDDQPVILRFDNNAANALQDWRREVKEMEADRVGLFVKQRAKLSRFRG